MWLLSASTNWIVHNEKGEGLLYDEVSRAPSSRLTSFRLLLAWCQYSSPLQDMSCGSDHLCFSLTSPWSWVAPPPRNAYIIQYPPYCLSLFSFFIFVLPAVVPPTPPRAAGWPAPCGPVAAQFFLWLHRGLASLLGCHAGASPAPVLLPPAPLPELAALRPGWSWVPLRYPLPPSWLLPLPWLGLTALLLALLAGEPTYSFLLFTLRLCDLHLVAWMGLGPDCLVAVALAAPPLPVLLPHCLLMLPIPSAVWYRSSLLPWNLFLSLWPSTTTIFKSKCFSSSSEKLETYLSCPPATRVQGEIEAQRSQLNPWRKQGPKVRRWSGIILLSYIGFNHCQTGSCVLNRYCCPAYL